MTNSGVFDCHHHVGDPSAFLGRMGDRSTAAGLEAERSARLEIMERGGVAQAAVIPGHSYDRSDGMRATRARNDTIAAYRDSRPDRFPVAVGVVEPFGDQAGAEIRRCHAELGLAGISFHPRMQGISMDSRWVHSCVEILAELGMVPVLHAMNETPDEALWKVAQLARSFPGVQMLVFDAFCTFEGTKEVSFVADLCPDLVFDTALSYTFDYAADVVRRFGGNRVAFGTDLYSPPQGRRISHILDEIVRCELSDGDKQAVLGGTARRLFRIEA